MTIYLDNCSFNRPFDDQSQPRVRLEAEAKLWLQESVRRGAVGLAWSYILDYENEANPFDERRTTIAKWKRYARVDVEESPQVLRTAGALENIGLKAKDALHLACAIAAGCDYFVTTDDRLLKRDADVPGVRVVDPTALMREGSL